MKPGALLCIGGALDGMAFLGDDPPETLCATHTNMDPLTEQHRRMQIAAPQRVCAVYRRAAERDEPGVLAYVPTDEPTKPDTIDCRLKALAAHPGNLIHEAQMAMRAKPPKPDKHG